MRHYDPPRKARAWIRCGSRSAGRKHWIRRPES
jgi:hypothetical protein